jgi:Acyl-CoA dehydrogenase, N-terminal domain
MRTVYKATSSSSPQLSNSETNEVNDKILGRPGAGDSPGEAVASGLDALRKTAQLIASEVLAPNADQVDTQNKWPSESLHALADAGLTGLHVPARFGGLEQGMEGLVTVTEALATACSSTALCYAMHCVASAVIAAKVTERQIEKYLKPIAAGDHIATLARSEERDRSAFLFPPRTTFAKRWRILPGGNQGVCNQRRSCQLLCCFHCGFGGRC